MKKDKYLNIRTDSNTLTDIKNLAKNLNISQGDLIKKMLQFYKENNSQTQTEEIAENVISEIVKTIQLLQAIEQYEEEKFTEKDSDFLSVLNFCYQLLIRTELVLKNPANTIKTPEKMKDGFGNEPEHIYTHALATLEDFEDIKKCLSVI